MRAFTHLEEWDSVLAGDGLSPLLADDPLVIHVAFVAQDHLLNVLVGVFLKWDWSDYQMLQNDTHFIESTWSGGKVFF